MNENKTANELILEEIRKSRQELKATIEAVEVRISLKIEETNRKLNKIEKEYKEISEKIEKIEIKQKENNIIIFGLHKTPEQINLQTIRSEIKKLVDVDINESDLNNFYPLGKKENCPVKVEFVSYLKKKSILSNGNKLKGTNVSIVNDLTIKQQHEHKILRKHLYLAKQDGNHNSYIRRNKLHVNNEIYSAQELEQQYVDGCRDLTKPNSASETPAKDSNTNFEHPAVLTNNKPASNTPGGATGRKVIKETARKLAREETKDDKIKTRSNKISK